jgi:hypothetical protein
MTHDDEHECYPVPRYLTEEGRRTCDETIGGTPEG